MKTLIISKVLVMVAIGILMSQYPCIKNIKVESVEIYGGRVHITGVLTLDYSQPKTYHEGNFYYFDSWWQTQEGSVYNGFRIVSVDWTLLKETPSQSKLRFNLVLERA